MSDAAATATGSRRREGSGIPAGNNQPKYPSAPRAENLADSGAGDCVHRKGREPVLASVLAAEDVLQARGLVGVRGGLQRGAARVGAGQNGGYAPQRPGAREIQSDQMHD